MNNKTIVPEQKKSIVRTKRIVFSGMLAALYVVLTLPFAQIAYGPIQVRLAEILTILPCFTPYAIPGVTLGCFLANLFNPGSLGPIDVIFGTLATLLAAITSRAIGKKAIWPGIIPPIVFNGLIVGTYLVFLIPDSDTGLAAIFLSMLSVGGSEAVLLLVLGIPFIMVIKKTKLADYLKRL